MPRFSGERPTGLIAEQSRWSSTMWMGHLIHLTDVRAPYGAAERPESDTSLIPNMASLGRRH